MIDFCFWRYFGANPFGHAGRRIADFYAGLVGDFGSTQKWRRLRRTKHDHHPVHDALGFVPGRVLTLKKLAPRAGLEPATLRLTAGCSAIELPRIEGRSAPAGVPKRADGEQIV